MYVYTNFVILRGSALSRKFSKNGLLKKLTKKILLNVKCLGDGCLGDEMLRDGCSVNRFAN